MTDFTSIPRQLMIVHSVDYMAHMKLETYIYYSKNLNKKRKHWMY